MDKQGEKLMEMLEAAHKSCCVPTFFSMAEAYKLIFMQMADYLIAHGAIIPPCKVGDKVYALLKSGNKVQIATGTITYFKDEQFFEKEWGVEVLCLDENGDVESIADGRIHENDFGELWYLSREEAEKALEKQQ